MGAASAQVSRNKLILRLVDSVMCTSVPDAKTVVLKTAELLEKSGEADTARQATQIVDRRSGTALAPFSVFTNDEYLEVPAIARLVEKGRYGIAIDKLIFNMNLILIRERRDGYREAASDSSALLRSEPYYSDSSDKALFGAGARLADYLDLLVRKPGASAETQVGAATTGS